MQAKLDFRNGFASQCSSAELEKLLEEQGERRRADVLFTGLSGGRVAVEIQHTSIGIEEIFIRTKSYMEMGIGVLWIPLVEFKEGGEPSPDKLEEHEFSRYQASPWERWANGLYFKVGRSDRGLWYYETKRHFLWFGRLNDQWLEKEGGEWRDSSGAEQYSDDTLYRSKRWRVLTLRGPYRFSDLELQLYKRDKFSGARIDYPGGLLARLVPRSIAK